MGDVKIGAVCVTLSTFELSKILKVECKAKKKLLKLVSIHVYFITSTGYSDVILCTEE